MQLYGEVDRLCLSLKIKANLNKSQAFVKKVQSWFNIFMKQISPYAELMAKNAVTQAEIAEELGYSKQAVNSWFTGKVEPKLSLNDWNKLAKLFNTSIADLPLSFALKPIQENSVSKT